MSGAPSKCLLWFNGQNFDHCIAYGALVVSLDIHHTSLRAGYWNYWNVWNIVSYCCLVPRASRLPPTVNKRPDRNGFASCNLPSNGCPLPAFVGGSFLQPWAEAQSVRTQDVDLGLLGDFLLLDIGDAVGPAGPAVGVVRGEEEEVVA